MTDDILKRQCFVGLFDILGFRNIVKNDKLEDVWKAYRETTSHSSYIMDNLDSLFKSKIINIDSFSDTFLIYTADHSNLGQEAIDTHFTVLLAVCDALFHSANTNKFPIRGAITVGELIVKEGIHIGKPIVDAYEMEQKQDWIGCWICDDAIKLISKELLQRHMDGKLIFKYKIPFKSADIIYCYVFNWVYLPFEEDYDYGFLVKKPGHDWSVERKHRNTRDYIKFVQSSFQKK